MARIQPNVADIQARYKVNFPGAVEVVWQPLYDRLAYPTAGVNQLVFFQNPIGQAGRTKLDTNMTNAGVLPAQQNMLVTGIQVEFLPGGTTLTTTVGYASDVASFNASGWLDFIIGSKNYANDAPLGKFPPQYRLDLFQNADASGAPVMRSYAQARGAYYEIVPVLLESQQNFAVNLNWPVLVPTPSGQNATIRVTLDGYLIRSVQ